MGKIIVVIDDQLEDQLRRYISRKYPTENYGKIKKTIEEALKEYMEKHK